MDKIQMKNANGDIVVIPQSHDFETELKAFAREKFGSKAGKMIEAQDSSIVHAYLDEKKIALADVLAEYGFENIGRVKVEALYQNDGTKPLFNAVVEEYMREAFEKVFSAAALIARKIPLDQLVGAYQVAVDHADDDVDFVKIGQGAPIPVSTIKLDTERAVKVFKRGRGIELTDEAKSMNFDMLAMQLRLRAKRMAKSEFDYVIDRLLNGSDTFDQAPSIGVKTSGTLKLADMWYAQNYMRTELGFEPKIAVMNMKTAEIWATLQESVHGLLFLQNLSNGTMPDVINASPMIASGIPDNRIVLVDPDFALVEYVYRDLFTETGRNVETQVEGSYTTKISDILPFEKNARLILKIDVART